MPCKVKSFDFKPVERKTPNYKRLYHYIINECKNTGWGISTDTYLKLFEKIDVVKEHFIELQYHMPLTHDVHPILHRKRHIISDYALYICDYEMFHNFKYRLVGLLK